MLETIKYLLNEENKSNQINPGLKHIAKTLGDGR